MDEARLFPSVDFGQSITCPVWLADEYGFVYCAKEGEGRGEGARLKPFMCVLDCRLMLAASIFDMFLSPTFVSLLLSFPPCDRDVSSLFFEATFRRPRCVVCVRDLGR